MKWSLLLIIMTCFSLNGAWAEDVQVQEIGLDDTSSFQSEPFEPLGVENEMTLSNEGLGGDSKKESSLIPEQPAVDVVAEPIDYFAPESMRHDRQDQEYSTEQQIAEKLEQDRINAERNRAQ